MSRVLPALAALGLLLPLAGCGGSDDEATTTLTVYAAASLTSTSASYATFFAACIIWAIVVKRC